VSSPATRELGSALRRWAPHGVGVVRVLDKHGFGTVEAGQLLAAGGVRRGRGFLGALGSRRTQSARRGRLTCAGLSAEELSRLHAPIGLDLGARTPGETAVSIVAEVIAVRGGRGGAALAGVDGRIGW
jgi:xanthine dehydrogenase accessory factor